MASWREPYWPYGKYRRRLNIVLRTGRYLMLFEDIDPAVAWRRRPGEGLAVGLYKLGSSVN